MDITQKLTNETLKDLSTTDGSSLNIKGRKPKTGYMISTNMSNVVKIDIRENLGQVRRTVEKYILDNLVVLSENEKYFVGTWIDKGFIYIELSENVETLTDAVNLGYTYGQLAIYDIKSKTSINLSSTFFVGGEIVTGFKCAHNTAFYKGLKTFESRHKTHKVGYKLLNNWN